MALRGSTISEQIRNYLFDKGLPENAVFGLMANIFAESGNIPTNLQNSYEGILKYTDATYTAAVDNGTYSNFVGDKAGYGLCQWTSSGRKQGLLNHARSKAKSIGDAEMQLDYMMIELNGSYKSVLSGIMSAASIREASDIVMTKFERPKDQSAKAKETRSAYGQKFYDEYKSSSGKITSGTGIVTLISNCGSDENGKTSGGVAGDQTGKEWYVRNWYSSPWKCVLRHPDPNVRALLADLAKKAALNDKVGYDQSQRDTYWTQLQKAGYDPSAITIACEADCSSGVTSHVKAAGYLLGNQKLQNCKATYTGNMRAGLQESGFDVLTDSKYLTSSAYLLAGDILLNDGVHTATNLTDGYKASSDGTVPSTKTVTYTVGQIYTTQVELKVRKGPGTNYLAKSHEELTADGQKHDIDRDGAIDAGTRVTCKQVAYDGADIWILTPSGWLAAYYQGKIYIK